MVRQSAFLAFAALLLISPFAGATVPAVSSASGTPEFMTPAVSTPGCSQAELPQGNPTPTFKAGTCGSCSEPICQGAALGAACKFQGGRIYKCTNVYGNLCSTSPLTHDCKCWFGPLP